MTDNGALETSLILRVLSSADEQAFGQLVVMHQSRVRGLLRRLCGSSSNADDLAQEVFVIAYQKLSTYQGRGRFGAWLCSIAYRQFLQAQRQSTREQHVEAQFAAWQDTNARAIHPDQDSTRIDLERALQSLPSAESAAIILNMTMGFSHPEVATVMQLPLGTVKSHIHRGLAKLKQQLSATTEQSLPTAVREKST